MIAAFPPEQQAAVAAALELESEPLNVIAQVFAYREMMLMQRVNDGVAACMLSHSTFSDLDNLGANNNTQRLVTKEATDTTEAVYESDAAFRLRIQSAFEGLSVAGPTGAYEYFAKAPAVRWLTPKQPARHLPWSWSPCFPQRGRNARPGVTGNRQ